MLPDISPFIFLAWYRFQVEANKRIGVDREDGSRMPRWHEFHDPMRAAAEGMANSYLEGKFEDGEDLREDLGEAFLEGISESEAYSEWVDEELSTWSVKAKDPVALPN